MSSGERQLFKDSIITTHLQILRVLLFHCQIEIAEKRETKTDYSSLIDGIAKLKYGNEYIFSIMNVIFHKL